MTGEEAKVRVRLDTGQAKAELAGLSKIAANTAGRIGSGITSAVSRGVNVLGLGAGIGAGIAAVRGPTEGGFSAVASEIVAPLGHYIESALLGTGGQQARADKAAREETMNAFAAVAGAQGAIPPAARAYFNQVRAMRMQEEHGRYLIESDPGFRTTDPYAVVDRLMAGIAQLFQDLVAELKNAIVQMLH